MSASQRLVVVWWPQWSAVAAGLPADQPGAVLHANQVVAHTPAAAAEGIVNGMRRRAAQARCPHLQIVAHDPGRDARRFDAVVQAVSSLVPRLEIGEPGMLTFAARGPSKYFGGDESMAARVSEVAAGVLADGVLADGMLAGGAMGVGVADGRFAATIAAHQAAHRAAEHVVVVAPGLAATRSFLDPLSVRWLHVVGGLAVDVVDLFHRLGIHHLADLADMPGADLMARFGHPGVMAHRLASGGDERPANTTEPPSGLHVQRVFDDPVPHVDTLVFVARHLAEQLVAQLGSDGTVCTRLLVTAETDHGERCEREWYRPTGLSLAAMVERVRWQLDAWAEGSLTAGVTLLRLEPTLVRRDDGVQLGFWGGRTQADEWAARAVARLATVVGEQQVLVPASVGGRQPADRYTWVPAVTADLADPTVRLAAAPGPWPGQLPSPSPATVLATPLPVDLLDGAGRAVRVSGRGVISAAPATLQLGGQSGTDPVQQVVAWAGPWPLDERWWDAARASRSARCQVLTADGRLFVVNLHRQQWWLLAEYS